MSSASATSPRPELAARDGRGCRPPASHLRGNHDRWFTEHSGEGLGARTAWPSRSSARPSAAGCWTASHPGTASGCCLPGTPASDVQNLDRGGGRRTPPPAPMAVLRDRLGEAGMAARLVLCGHSHRTAWCRCLAAPGGEPRPRRPAGFRITANRRTGRKPARRMRAMPSSTPAGACPVELLAESMIWESAARRAEEIGAGPAGAYHPHRPAAESAG